MSAKKGRRAKVLTEPQPETQKGSPNFNDESPNLSAIERASFLEGLQQSYGNPLHSTALEEDFNVLEAEGMTRGKAERKEIPQTLKTTVKQRGAAAKRKETERDGENEEEEEKKNRGKAVRKEIPQTSKTTVKQLGAAAKRKETERDGENEEEEEKKNRGKAVRKEIPQTSKTTVKQLGAAAKRKETERDGENEAGNEKKKRSRKSTGVTSAARPVRNQQMKKGNKGTSGSGSGMSSDPESQDKSDSGTAQQSRKRVLSAEEEEDEDMSWCPSPKKAKVYSLGTTRKSSSDKSKPRGSSSEKSKPRKSSSGSASAEPKKANTNKRRRKRRGRRGGTQLEVVLDAFLDFCDQYRETVESNTVKKSIDYFSSNVEEQLLEKISSSRELKVLKRENAKVGSLTRTTTQRLLDARYEVMRVDRQMSTLRKERAELNARLADLRRGQAFLADIRELNRQYLDYRHKHPQKKETYGATSLPALLLETKYMQTAGHQLSPLKKRLKKNKTQK